MSATKKTLEDEAKEFKKKRTPRPKITKQESLLKSYNPDEIVELRNEFAAAALGGLLAAARERVNAEEAVEESFRYADLMLLQLQKEKEAD